MKKLTPTLFLLFLSLCIYGQSPEKMSYQAVIRDASNTLVTNQSIGMQISILQTTITGTTVYAETHTVTTNLNGLVSLEIGTGSTSDTFSTIDWSAGPYFIKTETDPTGGSSYTITGTSQLMSVPFAMYAKSSGNGITTDQSDAIVANTAKVGYADALVSANTDVAANTAKVGYTEAAVSANTDVAANTAKVGYTEALVSANTDVVANTAKTGITTDQSDAIVANTAKTGITSDQSDAIVANTAKTGITSDQADAIVANTAKTGITSDQSDAIVANTAKVGYTEALVSANTDVAANTAKYSKNEVDALIANLQSKTEARVGDFRGGGVVFWVDPSDNRHGLIAAIEDHRSGIRWYNGSYTTTGATATTIGTGSANTDAIIAAQGATETSYAARVARAYTGGGFTDWFLPSKDELIQMYTNKATINTTALANGGSNFPTNYYWSSTEVVYDTAWVQYFNNGSQVNTNKVNSFNVRAVRAF